MATGNSVESQTGFSPGRQTELYTGRSLKCACLSTTSTVSMFERPASAAIYSSSSLEIGRLSK